MFGSQRRHGGKNGSSNGGLLAVDGSGKFHNEFFAKIGNLFYEAAKLKFKKTSRGFLPKKSISPAVTVIGFSIQLVLCSMHELR
jgi:hypothetical protein